MCESEKPLTMYNKEALRKELEDAMRFDNDNYAVTGQDWLDMKERYITTRLDALDDGDEKKGQCNDPAIYYKDDVVDDGQEGRGQSVREEIVKIIGVEFIVERSSESEKFTIKLSDGSTAMLSFIKSKDVEGLQGDEDSVLSIFNKDREYILGIPVAFSKAVRALIKVESESDPALPVGDGEGEKDEYEYQLCPKCGGQGIVSKPPWIPGDVHKWSAGTITNYQCNVCNGNKVISRPLAKDLDWATSIFNPDNYKRKVDET